MVALQKVESQNIAKTEPVYTVELVCVGNELLIGKTPNTNARWLANRVTRLGAFLSRETTIRDNPDEIASSIKEALRRKPDLIITTGGLGPTHDDMTLRGVAKAIGRPVRLNQTAVRLMKAHYRMLAPLRNIRFNKPRLKMAYLPVGSRPIENPAGSAPAVMKKQGRTTIISLPGVPKEFKAIYNSTIAPLIRSKTGTTCFVQERLMLRGIVESELSPIIDKVMCQYPDIFVKSHPRGWSGRRIPQIELHFTATSPDQKKTREDVLGAAAMLLRVLSKRKGKTRVVCVRPP